MSTPQTGASRTVVVGLGKTGMSVVRYLRAQGTAVAVTDTRAAPPNLAALRALAPEVTVRAGGLDPLLLNGADAIVVSPGIAARGAFFDAARARGLPVLGDIELFARARRARTVRCRRAPVGRALVPHRKRCRARRCRARPRWHPRR